MASANPQSTITSGQPVYGADPFKEWNNEWNVGLMSCCDDISQCKIILK
jgi:hypothetical protein